MDLNIETILDADIQFQLPISINFENPKAIFLTGATGFFGAYLLDELLHKTDADIYCLVRGENYNNSGKQRLEEHLRNYSLWQQKFSTRIVPVQGDLAQPLFGLSAPQFQTLAEKIDVIYHNGAWVNAVYPYSSLKAANVDGTVEILRLAGLIRTKPLHFISTVAVFFNGSYKDNQPKILETDSPQANLKGGYKQSKWVAENLVINAKKRGLPASIYRTSRIMGHSQTGINQNFNDFLISMIKICIQIGSFPDWKTFLNLVPVDYAAQSLIHLSQQVKSSDKIFHLLNPQSIAWEDFFSLINDSGYSVKKVSPQQWQTDIQSHANENNQTKFHSLSRMLLKSSTAMSHPKPELDMRHTLTGLSGSTIKCPLINKKLVFTWLAYFKKSGQLGFY